MSFGGQVFSNDNFDPVAESFQFYDILLFDIAGQSQNQLPDIGQKYSESELESKKQEIIDNICNRVQNELFAYIYLEQEVQNYAYTANWVGIQKTTFGVNFHGVYEIGSSTDSGTVDSVPGYYVTLICLLSLISLQILYYPQYYISFCSSFLIHLIFIPFSLAFFLKIWTISSV